MQILLLIFLLNFNLFPATCGGKGGSKLLSKSISGKNDLIYLSTSMPYSKDDLKSYTYQLRNRDKSIQLKLDMIIDGSISKTIILSMKDERGIKESGQFSLYLQDGSGKEVITGLLENTLNVISQPHSEVQKIDIVSINNEFRKSQSLSSKSEYIILNIADANRLVRVDRSNNRNEKFQIYALPSIDGGLKLGMDGCSGNFRFSRQDNYKLTVHLLSSRGEIQASSKTIEFKS